MQIFFMSSSDIIFLSAVQQQWRHMLPRLLSYVHGNTSMFWSFTLYSFSVTTESKSFLFMCNKFLGCHQTLTWKFYPHNMGGKGEGRGVLSTRKDIHLITGTIVRREVIVSWSTDAVSTVGGRWTRFSQRCAAVAMVVEEEKQRERERERESLQQHDPTSATTELYLMVHSLNRQCPCCTAFCTTVQHNVILHNCGL